MNLLKEKTDIYQILTSEYTSNFLDIMCNR